MAKNIYDKLKKIEVESCNIDVTKYKSDRKADNDRLIREFNKGKSFEFNEWKSLTKYSNDDFEQDFVTYNNALLACRYTHISENPPELIYDEDSGMVIGVNSPEWIFVFATGINKNTYYLDDAPYGVPVYTQKMLSELGYDNYPDKYLQIRDFDEEIEEKELGESYLNILFSAIRSLQAEVSRLRNAFKYGINSYTGTNTAMSEIVDTKGPEEEPLWAVDQSDLSGLASGMINFESGPMLLKPLENIDFTNKGVAKISDEVCWEDSDGELENLTDPKIYLYTTSSNLNIKYVLKNLDFDKEIIVDLNSLFSGYDVEKYNTLFMLSRKVANEYSDTFYGYNYAWISISNRENNEILYEGYYNPYSNEISLKKSDFGRCYLSKVIIANTNLYKFDMYSKYQDFSEEVNPSTPSDSDYKYNVAHITIRSVKDYAELKSIESKLPNNELVWDENSKKLYIKSKDAIVPIGTASGPDNPGSGMGETDIIEMLQKMGIVYIDSEGKLQLSKISDATFINNDTGKSFKFEVSPEGELIGNEVPEMTLADRINALKNINKTIGTETSYRAFIAKLLCAENGKDPLATSDVGQYADRVLITSVYCPLASDTKFGCTHGYIELENTCDSDIPLEGCYLHFLRPNNTGGFEVLHLPLKGILRSGSTYLIRCKKYADPSLNADVVINVDSYDQEWYINGELVDLTISDSSTSHGFALTYGLYDNYEGMENGEVINENTSLWIKNVGNSVTNQQQTWKWYYIDSLVFNANATDAAWADQKVTAPSNSIVKRTFSLDPAKQAFTATTLYDSSRYRNANVGTDIQIVDLTTSEISFPHSPEKYPIERYTPKSSKYHKNVSTDKTKLDMEKPNMVTCAFGIDSYTTRCFNWISAGQFDEYVFLKNGDEWIPFESYKNISEVISETTSYPRRKEFTSVDTNNVIYARISNTFPGFNVNYTSHKCILKLRAEAVSEKTTYTYIVGRMDQNGNPDFNHCSEEYTFTLYPTSAKPRIYQTTDQQGFHWVEYQAWAASAIALNNRIESDCANDPAIIPVLVNTGDMTQNGTRINEWLDYYNAGKPLFKHLEQMNVTGNNDLCGTDPTVLGTGNDVGKSNSYYFHVFYCYEVNESEGIIPIIQGDDGIKRYVPSLYYFDFENYRVLMCNSEITFINCRDWFKKNYDANSVVNVYTGWTVPVSSTEGSTVYVDGFTTIYTMLYNILNENKQSKNRKVIAACHEMPFTVITRGSMAVADNVASNSRSFNTSTSSLIGCHMNQLTKQDTKGIYWFSRLLEYFGVKLCIGGHKHTYAVSHPVREFYYWDGGNKNSLDNASEVKMENTLKNDDLLWSSDNYPAHLSKLPIINQSDYNEYSDHTDHSNFIHPKVIDTNNTKSGVVYYMCQATGYKLTSNKELPSPYQEFAQLIPSTGLKADGSDSPDSNQRRPMFSIIDFDVNNKEFSIALLRIENILYIKSEKGFNFTQTVHGTGDLKFLYATRTTSGDKRFCTWKESNTISYIITV